MHNLLAYHCVIWIVLNKNKTFEPQDQTNIQAKANNSFFMITFITIENGFGVNFQLQYCVPLLPTPKSPDLYSCSSAIFFIIYNLLYRDIVGTFDERIHLLRSWYYDYIVI